MNKKSFPLSKVYQLLEPGPVVMVSTFYKGKANVMTMSWHMMIDFQPPLVAIVVGDQSYSFNALKETKECVINIPTVKLISKVISVGNTSGSKIDKFKKFNLSQENALHVKAPIISECYANLECKVIDAKMSSKYNIFILEVLKAWVTPLKKRALTIHHCGNGTFVVDRKVIKIPSNKK